jgi:tetratricopeptide (TPR) repeat protein
LKNPTFRYTAALLVTLLLAATLPSFAQRDRKKKPVETKPSEARLREAEFFFIEGEKYFVLEDYTKSLVYFQRVVELNPDNGTVHYKIAEILSKGAKEEDLQKAAISIDNALKFEKKNKYFYILASSIYAGLNNFGKAEQALETMIREIKGTDDYLYELAALYQYDKKPDEAIKVYNRAESILGINEVSSLQKQRLYLEKGKLNEAIQEGEKLIDAFPEEERFIMGFAETLSQYKQTPKAIDYIEKYLNENPEKGNARMLLAGLYRDNGEEEKSRSLMESVFTDPSVDVTSKAIIVGTYNAYLSQNRSKNISDPNLESFTVSLWEKLVTLYPFDSNVHMVGGDLFMTLKKEARAQQEYLKAIETGATSFETWQNLLFLDSQLNQFDSLIVHAERGLELFPNHGMLYYFNGYGQFRKKNYREAVSALEQAKKLSASNDSFVAEINGMLGDAYNGLKEYQKSDKAYDEALAFNPNNSFVLNNYSYYLALRKENLEKAEKMSAQLIKSNPDNSSYLDTYSWVLYNREKYREARKVMERAISGGRGSATHFEHYGDILFKLGDIDGAVTQWQKSKSMDSGNALIDKKIANRKLY